MVKNKGISRVHIGQHVLANWKGGVKYYIGYVTAKTSNDLYTVTFDDNDEASYHPAQLTEFPDHRSARKGKEGIYSNIASGRFSWEYCSHQIKVNTRNTVFQGAHSFF